MFMHSSIVYSEGSWNPPASLLLSRHRLRLHRDCVPAQYLLHRHPGLGCVLPVPGGFRASPSLNLQAWGLGEMKCS